MVELDKEKVIGLLNRILEQELAGVVRYTLLFSRVWS
jgi:bacterioferritin (cytochrome b1)